LARYDDLSEPEKSLKARATWAREEFGKADAVLRLKSHYLNAGPAFKHLMGMLIAIKYDIEDAMFRNHKDSHGHDMTEDLRAQRKLLYKILAIPAMVDKAEEIADQLQEMVSPPMSLEGGFEFGDKEVPAEGQLTDLNF
jgi:hypothetical protein